MAAEPVRAMRHRRGGCRSAGRGRKMARKSRRKRRRAKRGRRQGFAASAERSRCQSRRFQWLIMFMVERD